MVVDDAASSNIAKGKIIFKMRKKRVKKQKPAKKRTGL